MAKFIETMEKEVNGAVYRAKVHRAKYHMVAGVRYPANHIVGWDLERWEDGSFVGRFLAGREMVHPFSAEEALEKAISLLVPPVTPITPMPEK